MKLSLGFVQRRGHAGLMRGKTKFVGHLLLNIYHIFMGKVSVLSEVKKSDVHLDLPITRSFYALSCKEYVKMHGNVSSLC